MVSEWNGHTLVHWWYTPPSYNTWISSDQLPSNKLYGNAKNEKPKWKISNEWLEQSFKFNEWMLEWDYQLNSKGRSVFFSLLVSNVFDYGPTCNYYEPIPVKSEHLAQNTIQVRSIQFVLNQHLSL